MPGFEEPTAGAQEGGLSRSKLFLAGANEWLQARGVADNADALAVSTVRDLFRTLAEGAGLAPDGSIDRLRTLGDAAGAGLGVLAAAPWIPGASDVKTVRSSATANTTKATLLDPTSGKKARVVYITVTFDSATAAGFEVYFAAGDNIGSTAGKEIAEFFLDLTDHPSDGIVFPDGGGPVGAVDDVISIRSTGTTGTFNIIVGYREE